MENHGRRAGDGLQGKKQMPFLFSYIGVTDCAPRGVICSSVSGGAEALTFGFGLLCLHNTFGGRACGGGVSGRYSRTKPDVPFGSPAEVYHPYAWVLYVLGANLL